MASIPILEHSTRPVHGTPEPLPPLVLCADDDDSVRALCAAQLARAGYRTDTARNGREVLERLNEETYDAILLDLDMPLVHGATVLSVIAQKKPELLDRIVIMTGLPDAAFSYIDRGVVLRKPLQKETLLNAIAARCDRTPHDESATSRTVRMPAKDSVRAFVASLFQSYSS